VTAGRSGPADGRRSLGLVALVARRDYLRTVKRRGFVVGTALLPLGMGALLLLSSTLGSGLETGGTGPQDFELLVANESSLRLVSTVSIAPHVELVSREEGLERLSTGRALELYVVPQSYPAEPTVLRIEAPAEEGPFGGLQRQALQQHELAALLQASLLAGSEVPVETATRILVPLAIRAEATSGEPVSNEPSIVSFVVPFAFTMLFVLSIFITSGYLLQSVTEEKENRVIEIVLSSVPALPLMAGKILGLGAAGLTQVGVWVATGAIAVGLTSGSGTDFSTVAFSPLTLVLGLVYFALGYLAYGAIFSAVGAVAPGSREAQQYAGFFGFLAVAPLIFATIFLTDPESPVVLVTALIPFTAPTAMLLVLSLAPTPPWPLVAASLVTLGAFTLIATVVSARVFRATVLLYGVRPSVRNIVGAMFAR
jgi:ABC-2 type transport system permease protein